MKTNRQYLLWFVVVMMLCAALSIGCGGSSSSDNGDSEPTLRTKELLQMTTRTGALL